MRAHLVSVPVAVLVALAPAALPLHAEAPSRIYESPWNWEHPNELRLTEEETFPHTPYDGDWQTHSYYFMGRLDAGGIVVMNPFQWRYGVLGTWGMYLIVLDPLGRVFAWDGKLGDGSPEVAPSGMHVSAPNGRFDSGIGVHHWVVDVPGFSCDLTFRNVVPAWKPGSGVAWFDGEHYTAYSIPAPWAELSGTVTVNGETVDAAGQCLLDSSETWVPLTRVNAATKAARVWSPPGTPRADRWYIGTLITISHSGFGSLRLPMLLVAHGDRWVFTTKEFSFDVLEEAMLDDPPYPYPTRVALHARDQGYALEGVYTLPSLYYLTDVFQRLPKLFRVIASWFVQRPVITRQLARFEGTVSFPDGSTARLDLRGQAEFVIMQ
jgi:hypothetical protein